MPEAGPSPPKPIERQAIVVVHGQGQQRPMGTIRDFVDALWRFNPDLGWPVPPEGRPFWIVPDAKSELYDLQRLTTEPFNGRKTDFFELYYADLLDDTPIRNLRRWLTRVLFVDPADVTARMLVPWRALWLVSLVAVGLLIWVLLSVPELLHLNWLDAFARPATWVAAAAMVLAIGIVLIPKFFAGFDVLKQIPGWVVLLVIVVCFLVMFIGAPMLIGAAALGYLGYLSSNFLLPFFGDTASYLSAQTETVRIRQAVRTRGMTLLKRLHDDASYDRIVIVAHSLGTALAFDLLQILWQAVGPTKENPPEPEAKAALADVEAFALSVALPWTEADVATYQRLQWDAFNALRRQASRKALGRNPARPGGWKISDFVCLGSPLGHAQFLIADGAADFERMKVERVLPTAPPQPYDASLGRRFLDPNGAAHHAAVFSTVRWTNIHDSFDPAWMLLGDVISSPVTGKDLFGEAIRDLDIPVIRKGPVPRFFTHNHYWVEPNPNWKPASAHVQALRDAVGYDRS